MAALVFFALDPPKTTMQGLDLPTDRIKHSVIEWQYRDHWNFHSIIQCQDVYHQKPIGDTALAIRTKPGQTNPNIRSSLLL